MQQQVYKSPCSPAPPAPATGSHISGVHTGASGVAAISTASAKPKMAQSQTPQGQSDGAVLTPASDGKPSSAAMIVDLAPGSNTLQVSVTNIDDPTWTPLLASKITLDESLTIVNSSGTATVSGPVTTSGESALY